MIVWGFVRSFDERLLLGQMSHSGSIGVQIAGLVLAAAGLATLVVHWPKRAPSGESPSDVRDETTSGHSPPVELSAFHSSTLIAPRRCSASPGFATAVRMSST